MLYIDVKNVERSKIVQHSQHYFKPKRKIKNSQLLIY